MNIGSTLPLQFFSTIAGIMASYKRYPSRREYEEVAWAVVRKYPFLNSPLDGDVSYHTCLNCLFPQQLYIVNLCIAAQSDIILFLHRKRKGKPPDSIVNSSSGHGVNFLYNFTESPVSFSTLQG
jgi:hypothetical protein